MKTVTRFATFVLAVSLPTVAVAQPAPPPNTVQLELGLLSSSLDFGGESPAGSGLRHRAEIDASDALFGVSFEHRVNRRIGVRGGVLRSEIGMDTRSVCSPGPCKYSAGAVSVTLGDVTFRVNDKADALFLFAEVPFFVAPSDKLTLFAGPTLAHVEFEGVSSPGFTGLTLDAQPSSPAYGLHVGGTWELGYRGRWSAGFVARWLRTSVRYEIDQPLFAGGTGRYLSVDRDQDFWSVAFTVGRHFGG